MTHPYYAGEILEAETRAKMEKLETEIAQLKAELAERKARSDVWMKSDTQCREYANHLQRAISLMMSQAGHPDAAEACRLIIATGREALGQEVNGD